MIQRLLTLIVAVGSIHVASADQYPDLYEILDRQKGNYRIEIPTGTYILDVKNNGPYKFHDLTDIQINGNGSTIICNNQEQAFSFRNCVRVEFRDVTIDYDPLCFTQGRIVDVAEDHTWFDFLIDEGYPTYGIRLNCVEFYDPETRLLKENSITTYADSYSELRQIGERRFRAVKKTPWRAGERVGDLVVMDVKTDKKPAAVHTVMLHKCYNMKLENVTVYGSNCFSFYEKECYATEYKGCVVGRGPMPEGIQPRLRSGNADGIHSSQARKGPSITNCRVNHNGDDCIIVCGRSFPVGGVNEKEKEIILVTRESYPVFAKGDRLVVIGYDGTRKGELRLNSISDYTPTEEQCQMVVEMYPDLLAKPAYKLGFRLKVKEIPFEIATGDVIFNAEAVGDGFLIKDNDVGPARSRGILIKGSNGKVVSNRIRGCALAGILVSPEIQWMGGGFSSNVEISDNKIDRCLFDRSNPRLPPGALSVFYITGEAAIPSAGLFERISVERNTVTNCPYPALVATAVDGLRLSDNKVSNESGVERSHGKRYGADTASPVWEVNNRKSE